MKTGTRGRVDAAYWTRLLAVMREQPGNMTFAAARMGSDRKTISRLWNKGEPGTVWGARPMSAVLAAEQVAAAATRAQVASDTAVAIAAGSTVATPAQAAASRSDAVLTRSEEAKLLRAARANVLALLQLTATVSQGALKLAELLRESLRDKKKIEALSIPNAMLLLVRHQRLTSGAVLAADAVVELEHRIMGDPKDRQGDEAGLEADDMTQEEAIEELTKAAEIANRLHANGMRVIQGGASGAGGVVAGAGAGVQASAARVDPPPAPPVAAPPAPAGPLAPRGLRMNAGAPSVNAGPDPLNDAPLSVNDPEEDPHAQSDDEPDGD